MLGLLWKDLKNVRGQMTYYLIMFLLFAAVSVIAKNIYFYAGLLVFSLIAIPVSAIAYDEKDNWDKFVLAAGISRGQLVGARYLFSLLFFVPLWTLGFLFLLVPALDRTETITVLFLFGGIALWTADIIFPVVFRMGTEKARAAYLIAIVCVVVVCGGLVSLLKIGTVERAVWASVALFLIGAVGMMVSFIISNKIYKNKDF